MHDIEIAARPYSANEAARASARVIEQDGRRLGYIHFWYIHLKGVASLLKEKLEGDFAECDALVLDLRGRGGSGGAIPSLLGVLSGRDSTWDKPLVALIDHHSRSAKDVIAYEIRRREIGLLVGETTAGAVMPASFEEVGHDRLLMFPRMQLGRHTARLEGIGVEPHVVVREAPPNRAGDPILEAGLREAAKLADVRQPSQTRERANAGTAAAVGSVQQTNKSSADNLPAARDILKRMVDALGGEEAIRNRTVRTMTGRVDIAGMIEGKLSIFAAAPNFLLMRVELGEMGSIRGGYDGKVAWSIDPQRGSRILEGEELKDTLEQADFYQELNYERNYKSIRTVGRAQFGGKQCYELELTDESGSSRSMFVESKTFLPAGMRHRLEIPMLGEAEVTRTNEEFREFAGLKIVTRNRVSVGDIQEITTTITEVSFEPIDKNTFELPEEIRKLLKTE